MEKNIIRNGKFVEVIGIITTVVSLFVSILLVITKNFAALFCFFPFIGLGMVIILAYKREIIIVEDNKLTFYYLFKKPQQVKYSDIRCLLLVPLNNRTQMILVDRQYNRLVTLDYPLANLTILFEALEQKNIPRINFGELAENQKDTYKYLNALNIIERNYYKSIAYSSRTMEHLSKENKRFSITKTKKLLKIIGWILTLSNVVAYLIGGKVMVIILVSVLLVAYVIYLVYYPYIYMETTTKKGQEKAIQMPFIGAGIALLSCLSISQTFTYDFGSFIKITACLTVILTVPYVIKSARTEIPQKSGRKFSVILAILILSYTITFPLNFIATFDKPFHENITITDKRISSGKSKTYYLYGDWNGKETEFCVSKRVYNDTSIRDVRKICIKQSAFGLEYCTIHK